MTAEPQYIDIVFAAQTPAQGPDDMVSVEVEDHLGKSIGFGDWVHRPDGYWALRLTAVPLDLIATAHASAPRHSAARWNWDDDNTGLPPEAAWGKLSIKNVRLVRAGLPDLVGTFTPGDDDVPSTVTNATLRVTEPQPAPSASAAAGGDWVLVPREPTEAMLRAGATSMADIVGEPYASAHWRHFVNEALRVYRPMVAALATPPSATDDVRAERERYEAHFKAQHGEEAFRIYDDLIWPFWQAALARPAASAGVGEEKE